MTEEYSIVIDRKSQVLWHKEPGRVHRFAMDTRANPMVVYMHEYSDGRLPIVMKPVDQATQDRIVPRVVQFMMKNKLRLKVTFTGARTPRGNSSGLSRRNAMKHRKEHGQQRTPTLARALRALGG